jgi:hypothetical protein
MIVPKFIWKLPGYNNCFNTAYVHMYSSGQPYVWWMQCVFATACTYMYSSGQPYVWWMQCVFATARTYMYSSGQPYVWWMQCVFATACTYMHIWMEPAPYFSRQHTHRAWWLMLDFACDLWHVFVPHRAWWPLSGRVSVSLTVSLTQQCTHAWFCMWFVTRVRTS